MRVPLDVSLDELQEVEREDCVERRRGVDSDLEREWEERRSLSEDLRRLEFVISFEELEDVELRRLDFEPQFGWLAP